MGSSELMEVMEHSRLGSTQAVKGSDKDLPLSAVAFGLPEEVVRVSSPR